MNSERSAQYRKKLSENFQNGLFGSFLERLGFDTKAAEFYKEQGFQKFIRFLRTTCFDCQNNYKDNIDLANMCDVLYDSLSWHCSSDKRPSGVTHHLNSECCFDYMLSHAFQRFSGLNANLCVLCFEVRFAFLLHCLVVRFAFQF